MCCVAMKNLNLNKLRCEHINTFSVFNLILWFYCCLNADIKPKHQCILWLCNSVQMCSWCNINAAMQLTDEKKAPAHLLRQFQSHILSLSHTHTQILWCYQGNQNTRANYSHSCRMWDINSHSCTLTWTNTAKQFIYSELSMNPPLHRFCLNRHRASV